MPLSEHEQRLLEQMERALYAEDPKFVSSLRGTDLRSHHRRRALQAAVGFVAGIVLMMTGAVSASGGSDIGLVIGPLGFLLMLAAAVFAVSSWRRSGPAPEAGGAAPAAPAPKRKPAKRGMTERFEDRWRRRREEGP